MLRGKIMADPIPGSDKTPEKQPEREQQPEAMKFAQQDITTGYEQHTGHLTQDKKQQDKNRSDGKPNKSTDKYYDGKRLGIYDGDKQIIPEDAEAARLASDRKAALLAELIENPIVGDSSKAEKLAQGKVIPLDKLQTEQPTEQSGWKQRHDHHRSDSKPPERRYLPDNLSVDQIASLDYLNKTPGELQQIREEINRFGENPLPALKRAMVENDVLMIGEAHITPNALRDMGERLMPLVRGAGATQLAVEIQEKYQPELDKFNKTGKISEELREALKDSGLDESKYVAMLRSARSANLTITAVDLSKEQRPVPTLPEAFTGPVPPTPEVQTARCNHMASRLNELIEHGGKTVFWCGADDLQDSPLQDRGLAEQVGQTNKVFSVYAVLPQEKSALNVLASDLSAPVAVDTSKAEQLGSVPVVWNQRHSSMKFGDWDMVILYPPRK